VSVPVLSADSLAPGDVGRALRESGGFLLHPSVDGELCARAVKAAHDFFALPAAVKASTAIERSPHFRGWSELHNERDWREQIHLGRERPAAGGHPSFRRLDGPNLWPPDESWRVAITAYMDAVAELGERLLGCAAADLGLPPGSFAGVGREGYLVLKLIAYHPQLAAQPQRPGVAAHLDFSWITLTLQDSPGLEIMRPDGTWVQVEPRAGGLWVHAGELLQVASGGACLATPHRVINRSLDRTRVSLPLFLNPPLHGHVGPLVPVARAVAPERSSAASHVHRVLPPGAPIERFHFGEAEWRRKGLNGWCHACAPPRAP
jgi:isopenicillin N synthase-like dioxygenase